MKVTIRVTQDDIDYGEPDDPAACAIARPLRALIPGAEVDLGAVWIAAPGYDCDQDYYRHVADLPDTARVFVEQFDQDKALCAPITFDLEVPGGLARPSHRQAAGQAQTEAEAGA